MDTPSRIAHRPLLITAGTAVAVLIAVLVWALQPSGLDRLKDRDNAGGIACEVLIQWIDGTLYNKFPDQNKSQVDLSAQLTAGQMVSKATTASIRATWTGGGDVEALPGHSVPVHGVNLNGLYDACEAEGVNMPENNGTF